jgi:hypothetical protein
MRLFRIKLHRYVALVLLACVVTAVIVIAMLPPEQVTRANYDKIHVGMSLEEVEQLLGPPHLEQGVVQGKGRNIVDIWPQYHEWISAELAIVVMADDNDRVVDLFCYQKNGGFFERVWYWIVKCL